MRKLPAWGLAGVLLFGAGLWALAADIEGWNAVWYIPAWYGYLLVLDALIFRLQGRSFLAGRRAELRRMLFWSVPFWFLFEAFNLRLQNWYYVFGLRTQWLSAIVSVLAFATVLPVCLFHAELVKALGWWRGARCRPLRVTGAVELFCAAIGVLSVAAPLLAPRYAFGMVWGALLWLPEVINRRAGAPSLLADLEAGRCERLIHLLAGGLWAGAVWETFNFWARCKWIYTVPGFEHWKLFEMPLAGFLGFPILALSAFAYFSSFRHLLRSGGRVLARSAAVAAALLFSAMTFHAMFERTVQSRRPLLSDLDGMDSRSVAALRAAGVPTPERLFRTVRREGLAEVAGRTGLAPAVVERAFRHAGLALHKGMGTRAAALLRRAGIATVADLARADPGLLFLRVRAVADEKPPRLAEVKVWVRAARVRGETRR